MSEKTITYRGFDIEIIHDDMPCNPFTDWDGDPDLYVYYDGCIYAYIDSIAEQRPTLYTPMLTKKQILDNSEDLKRLFGYATDVSWLELFRVENWIDDRIDAVERVNDGLQELLDGEYDSNKLEMLFLLYNIAEIDAYLGTSNGYCQGDWAIVLIVATPEWKKQVGIPGEYTEEMFEATLNLYSAWAWGDCYGYRIEFPDDEDSCWGFYGTDHEKSGLLEYAKNAIDCHIEYERKQHFARIKKLIKAHVPLIYRPVRPV